MNKKKKILMASTATAAAIAVMSVGALAIFIGYDHESTDATVGSVFVETTPIIIGENTVYSGTDGTGDVINYGYSSVSTRVDLSNLKLNTYSYGADAPCRYWVYKEGLYLVNDVYFRAKSDTAEDVVAYCVDYGLASTDAEYSNGVSTGKDGTTILDEASIISDDVKRVLQVGYPNKGVSDYFYAETAEEVEWATSVAIYIADGTAYNEDGSYKANGEMRLDDFYTNLTAETETFDDIIVATALVAPEGYYPSEEAKETSLEKSIRLKNLIEEILDASEKVSTVSTFHIDNSGAFTEPHYDDNGILVGYKTGPFVMNNNIGKASIVLETAEGESTTAVAWNANEQVIQSLDLTYEDPFYVFVPVTEVSKDIQVKATSNGKTMQSMNYYWAGDKTEQKMISMEEAVPTSVVTIPKLMFNGYDAINPGDVLTVKWSVVNKGTKGVVTRNIVSIYWDGIGEDNKEISSYSNHKDIVYLYPESTDSSAIFNEQFGLYPDEYRSVAMDTCSYKEMGSMAPIFVNGEEKAAGYSFIVYGDALDGVGHGAETGLAQEQNYGSTFDDSDDYRDDISFKLAISSRANIHNMDANLIIRVETQAMQYMNTSNYDWNTLFRDSYFHEQYDNSEWDSYWKTTTEHEYVLSTGALKSNDPTDNGILNY